MNPVYADAWPMDNRYNVEYEMTDQLANQVGRAVLADRRLFLQFGQWVGLPLLILTVLLFWPTLLVLRDSLSPAAIIIVAISVSIGYVLLLSVLVRRYASWTVLLPFLGQTQRTVRVIFSDEHIFMETGEISGEKNWKDIEAIHIYRNIWLFRLYPGGHFAVPAAVVSPEIEALIRVKAAAHGIDVCE